MGESPGVLFVKLAFGVGPRLRAIGYHGVRTKKWP